MDLLRKKGLVTLFLLTSQVKLRTQAHSPPRQCYSPQKSAVPDYPCNPTASVSTSCTFGWQCIAGGLCAPVVDTGNLSAYYRGTCTD